MTSFVGSYTFGGRLHRVTIRAERKQEALELLMDPSGEVVGKIEQAMVRERRDPSGTWRLYRGLSLREGRAEQDFEGKGIFLVRYDLEKCQPKWNGDLVRLFGERNQGIRVQADSPTQAVERVAEAIFFNKYYLRAQPA